MTCGSLRGMVEAYRRGVSMYSTDRQMVQKKKLQVGNWVVVDANGSVAPPNAIVTGLLPNGMVYNEKAIAPHFKTGQIVTVLNHSEKGIAYGVAIGKEVYFYLERATNFIR